MKDPKIIVEQFSSLGQFLDTISARTPNKVFKSLDRKSVV